MILTTNQLDILNHICEDGQAWADHVEVVFNDFLNIGQLKKWIDDGHKKDVLESVNFNSVAYSDLLAVHGYDMSVLTQPNATATTIKRYECALLNKLATHKANHDNAKASEGVTYENRVNRDIALEAAGDAKWASDVASAKLKRKADLNVKLAALFTKFVDPSYAKKARLAESGVTTFSIPDNIVNYVNELMTAGDALEIQIDSLTTVKEIRYLNLGLPVMPIV